MRNKLFLSYIVLLCFFFGGMIAFTQNGWKRARTVYLRMAPADPRALFSGDYMQLFYNFEQGARVGRNEIFPTSGSVTLCVDERGVASDKPVSFSGTPPADVCSGRLLKIAYRGGLFRVPHQFYFREGSGKRYEGASYVQLRQMPDGSLLASGLTDENLNLL